MAGGEQTRRVKGEAGKVKNLIGRESVDVKEWLLNIHELLRLLACLPRCCITPQSQQVSLDVWTNLHSGSTSICQLTVKKKKI